MSVKTTDRLGKAERDFLADNWEGLKVFSISRYSVDEHVIVVLDDDLKCRVDDMCYRMFFNPKTLAQEFWVLPASSAGEGVLFDLDRPETVRMGAREFVLLHPGILEILIKVREARHRRT